MRTWRKRITVSVVVLILALFFVALFLRTPLPAGSVPSRDIVSYCVGDIAGDGSGVLLSISGVGKTDMGERCGKVLLVCDVSAEVDMDKLGYIPPEKIYHSIDLSEIKPMKVQLGDINGDKVNEIAICVYKTARFHPVMAKRPFFFNLVDGNLIPVWLGSRLSRPFDDYILFDIDANAIDEIISIERLENNRRVVAVYNWKGFGFEILAESEGFDGELYFDTVVAGQTAESRGINTVLYNQKEHTKLGFRLIDGKMVDTILD